MITFVVGLSNQENLICRNVETLSTKKRGDVRTEIGIAEGTEDVQINNSRGRDKEKGGKKNEKEDSLNAVGNVGTGKGIRTEARKVSWSEIVSGKRWENKNK